MHDDTLRLFDRVVEQALGGESLEAVMEKCAIAMRRGDFERAPLIDQMVHAAVTLGNHAVTVERTRREHN